MSGLISGFGSVRVQAFCRVLVECAGQSGCLGSLGSEHLHHFPLNPGNNVTRTRLLSCN